MKNKFIKSTIILVIGGFLTKILGMFIRIISTRAVGSFGIGLYMMVLPTYNLFITISCFCLPLAISKIIAEESRSSKKLILGIIPIALLINFLSIFIINLIAPFIANNLMQNKDLTMPIIACSYTLPFISLSGILRGYFFGKQKMIPHVVSNVVEQVIRIILIALITPYLFKKSVIYAVVGLISVNIISELISSLILIIYLPKKVNVKLSDLKFNKDNFKDILAISIPNTITRIISSMGLFLEPIILTFIFLKLGYTSNYITNEYGIISGYVLPLVSLPSFLSGALSNALLPIITRYYKLKDMKNVKLKIKQACFYSLIIGIVFTLILFFFPSLCLKLIFNTTKGVKYLKFASITFFISYIEGPIISAMQAMDKSKQIMISNIIGIIIRTILLIILTTLDIGMYSLLIASFIYNIFIIIYQLKVIKSC